MGSEVRKGRPDLAVFWASQEYLGGPYQENPPGVVTMHNARYYPEGWAHDCRNFTAFTGKGCAVFSQMPSMCDGGKTPCGSGMEHISSCQPDHPNINPSLPKHGRVVTIAQVYGQAFYHFLAEDLTRAMPLLDEILADKTILVHVYNLDVGFVVDALQLIGIPRQRLIQGDGCAKVLHIPEPVGCGGPSFEMMHMARRRLRRALGCPMPRVDASKYVVMIKRHDTRRVDNHNAVQAMLESGLSSQEVSTERHSEQAAKKESVCMPMEVATFIHAHEVQEQEILISSCFPIHSLNH